MKLFALKFLTVIIGPSRKKYLERVKPMIIRVDNFRPRNSFSGYALVLTSHVERSHQLQPQHTHPSQWDIHPPTQT